MIGNAKKNNAADYFPYGKILREYNPQAEKFLTTHHERDTETGLDYRGARYYDSDIARFLSLDPLAANYPQWSSYNYVLGNPIVFKDNDGKAADHYREYFIPILKAYLNAINRYAEIQAQHTIDQYDKWYQQDASNDAAAQYITPNVKLLVPYKTLTIADQIGDIFGSAVGRPSTNSPAWSVPKSPDGFRYSFTLTFNNREEGTDISRVEFAGLQQGGTSTNTYNVNFYGSDNNLVGQMKFDTKAEYNFFQQTFLKKKNDQIIKKAEEYDKKNGTNLKEQYEEKMGRNKKEEEQKLDLDEKKD